MDKTEKVLEKLEEYKEETKLNLPPVIETKDVRTEVAAGRYVEIISPAGVVHTVRRDRLQDFKSTRGVTDEWIIK